MTEDREEWPKEPGKKNVGAGSIERGLFLLMAFVGVVVTYDAVRLAQFFRT